MKNNITTHPVSAWEQAIADRNDIEFIEVRLEKGGVTALKVLYSSEVTGVPLRGVLMDAATTTAAERHHTISIFNPFTP